MFQVIVALMAPPAQDHPLALFSPTARGGISVQTSYEGGVTVQFWPMRKGRG